MEFRPCIDIHDGKVKQIVGGSLTEADRASIVKENGEKAAYFANKTLRKVQKKVGFPERIR